MGTKTGKDKPAYIVLLGFQIRRRGLVVLPKLAPTTGDALPGNKAVPSLNMTPNGVNINKNGAIRMDHY